MDFTLETYSQVQAKAGQATLKAEIVKPSFASSLNIAMATNITSITVTSSSITPPAGGDSGTNVGLIVGLVVGILVLLVIIGVAVRWFLITPQTPGVGLCPGMSSRGGEFPAIAVDPK